MALSDFLKKLEDPESSEHEKTVKHVSGLLKRSREDMAKNYPCWDRNDDVFRGRRAKDREDRTAESKGEPAKSIAPLSFAQIMTFMAFSIMTVTQNQRFFELEPTGSEDNVLAEPMELILERDIRRNQWNAFLSQWFLDIGRFSIAASEVCYEESYRMIRIPQEEEQVQAFGVVEKKTTNNFQKIPTFIGNRIRNISPYRVFPDTRLPLTRYQEGEFFGSEDMFTVASLKSMEGGLFNLDKIPKLSEDELKERKSTSRLDYMPVRSNEDEKKDDFVTSGSVVISKMVCDVIPADLSETLDKGDEYPKNTPIRFLIWIANDKTVVRFEEAYWLHGMFPYTLSQYLPDMHQIVNEGLADICSEISTLVTWLMNAHVTSLRNNLAGGKVVIDPSGIDVKKLSSTSPWIFLKATAAGAGVDHYAKQFQMTDMTQNFMSDAGALKELLEYCTGMGNNAMGQYSDGRRSATQSKLVAQGAGARGKVTLQSIWDTGLEPLGKQLIANNRQEMDFETFSRIIGQREWPTNPTAPPQMSVDPATGQSIPIPVPYTTEEVFTLFKSDPVGISTSEDFFVFDGTSPSEKAFLAQSLQEVLLSIFQNPSIASVMGYQPADIRELFNQVYILRGVTPARLPTPAPAPSAPMPQPVAQPGALAPTATVSNG